MSKGPGGQYVLPPLHWKEAHDQSPRLYHDRPRQVYLHITAGHYDNDVALLTRPGGNSAHVVLREDGNDAYQLVTWARKAWTESVGNDAGLSIEMSLLDRPELLWAGWSVARRQQCVDQWCTAARIAGYWCGKYGIPPDWSMVNGGWAAPGLMRHYDLHGLGSPPSTHIDPTLRLHGDPDVHSTTDSVSWLWWVYRVKHEVARGDYVANWGRSA